MPKKPKWVKCPDCFNGRTGIPDEEIKKYEGVIDGCFGLHWWERYPKCKRCDGTNRIDLRA